MGLFSSKTPSNAQHTAEIHALPTPLPAKGPGREHWQLLVQAVEQLAAAHSLPEIIAVVRTHARRIAAADGVCFVMRENGYCHYVDEEAIGPLWKGKRFPIAACISGWAMINKQTVMVPDIYQDERIPHDAYRPTFVKSLLMVPVRMDDPIAAIGVYWAGNVTPHADTIAHLESLARATATAMVNVYMEARVAVSGERMQMALNAADMGAWEYDTAANTFHTSKLFRTHIGCGATAGEELSMEQLQEIIHPDDVPVLQKAIDKACTHPKSFGVEFRVRWGDGVYHPVELRGRALSDGLVPPRRLVGVSMQDTGAGF